MLLNKSQSTIASANDAEIGSLAEHQQTQQPLDKTVRNRSLSISLKVAIWFGVPLLFGLSMLFKMMLDTQRQFQLEQMNEYAGVIAEQLAATAVEPLFADATLELSVLTKHLPLTQSLLGVAIYDHQQQAVVTTGTSPPLASLDELIEKGTLAISYSLSGETRYHPLLLFTRPISFRDVVGGHVVVVFDQSHINAQISQTRYALISIAFVMVVFLAIVIIYFSHRITAPVRKLVDAATRIESGDMSPILERRNDELGQLISALNNMTRDLTEKSQIKEVLDRFVDPDISNKILSQLDTIDIKGENVNATVLFADIVGFTSLSETMEPDAVSTLLNEYFGYYSACARLHFGTVDKFLGDCIMIVFGATKEDPHHAYNAACCALLMQELTAVINQMRLEQGLDTIHTRIGINSGKMLAGLLGSRDRLEYTVVGDAVNMASRLCNEAEADEIIIQDTLYEQLQSHRHPAISEGKTIRVRGKSDPVTIYNLLDIQRSHSCSDRALMQDILELAKHQLTPTDMPDANQA